MENRFLITLPDREFYLFQPSDRADRWIWIDRASNNLLWLVSELSDPWVFGEVAVQVRPYRSSNKGGSRERHPIRCRLSVSIPQGGEISVRIEREVYTSAYAYHLGLCYSALSFPWEKRPGKPQVWLSYGFYAAT